MVICTILEWLYEYCISRYDILYSCMCIFYYLTHILVGTQLLMPKSYLYSLLGNYWHFMTLSELKRIIYAFGASVRFDRQNLFIGTKNEMERDESVINCESHC